MGLDIFCVLFYAMGVYKGLSRGLVAALLTLVGYIIALLMAIKFGGTLAQFITNSVGKAAVWIPTVSFFVVFICIILLFKFLISLFNKSLEFAMLGWLNKIGGVFFYLGLYSLILATLFYWLSHISFLQTAYLNSSFTYKILYNKMPMMINLWSGIWPSLKTSLKDIELLLQ